MSPKAIPQMRDTAELLQQLNLNTTTTKLLAIVANLRGAAEACSFDEIRYLGYPFSISETFQLRNTNSTINESLHRVEEIQNQCLKNKKELVVYLSMAFGNPYGDPWNTDIAIEWSKKLKNLDIKIIALSDTIGVSTKENIGYLFSDLIPECPDIEFGAHLHSRKENVIEKIKAAYAAGCKRFDSALHGFGGCPMAKDELTGNLPTEEMVAFLTENKISHKLDFQRLESASSKSWKIFNHYH